MTLRRRMRVETLEDRRMLATFTVTNLLDGPVTAAEDLPGSLRQAIFDANAAAGADEIQFSGVSGTLLLNSGEMRITDELTIDGPGANVLTIDAQQQSRVLNIDDPSVTNEAFAISINGLTFKNGRVVLPGSVGGAIRSATSGQLTINQSTLDNNIAPDGGGGAYARGAIIINDCIITNNLSATNVSHGGGISGRSTLIVTNSTIEGNWSVAGGGLFASGAITITASDISGNRGRRSGGGIEGLMSVTLFNSTIVDNEAGIIEGGGGGGISSSGAVTIYDSVVSGNFTTANQSRGGGISAYSGITIIRSTVNNNTTSGFNSGGGGLRLGSGIAIISESTITGNGTSGDSSQGGGITIPTAASLLIENSTISDNYTLGEDSPGGGVYGGQVSVTNSTISGNTTSGNDSEGGGIAGRGTMVIQHSTIVQNQTVGLTSPGGGIHHITGPLSINNSILANNLSASGNPELRNLLGTLSSFNYNLLKDPTGSGVTLATGMGNFLNIDPKLGPLQDNGGPTWTYELFPGSPAIDAGDPVFTAPPDYDQRGSGFDRVLNGRIDIGAYEYEAESNPLIVTTELDVIDEFDNLTSLREAILYANSLAGADTVTFHTGVFSTAQTISMLLGEYEITEELTIDGPGHELLTVDAQELSRIFNIAAAMGDFEIEGLTITHGKTTGNNPTQAATTFSGGAIRSITSGNLEISESTISGSSVTGDYARGGGVFASGSLTITASMITGNSTHANYSFGGGLYAKSGLVLTQSVVTNNSTSGVYSGGGGISVRGGVTIEDSTISNNTTFGMASDGGGLESRSGNAVIINSTIADNVTGDAANEVGGSRGGGIYSYGGSLSITNSTISGNHAGDGPTFGDPPYSLRNFSGHGGGVWSGSAVTVTSSTISGNFAGNGRYSDLPDDSASARGGHGGGIYSRGVVSVTNSTISGNYAGDASTYGVAGDGGGIWSSATITIAHSTITGNKAGESAAYPGDGGVGSGGGIWNDNDTITLTNSIIAGNVGASHPDIRSGTLLFANHSLIGDTSGLGTTSGGGNLLNVDPMLGPLAVNGGPTLTHALLEGSPAIDAGDPAFASPPNFDQRGDGYLRVFNGRIDIGAFELQPPPMLPGDFDNDGGVGGRDFLAWQRGESPDPWSGGDLMDWQDEYDLGGLVAEVSALSVDLEIPQVSATAGLSSSDKWVQVVEHTAGQASSGTLEMDAYVEEVDRAIEELSSSALQGKTVEINSTARWGVAPFGEMVARRALKRVGR